MLMAPHPRLEKDAEVRKKKSNGISQTLNAHVMQITQGLVIPVQPPIGMMSAKEISQGEAKVRVEGAKITGVRKYAKRIHVAIGK